MAGAADLCKQSHHVTLACPIIAQAFLLSLWPGATQADESEAADAKDTTETRAIAPTCHLAVVTLAVSNSLASSVFEDEGREARILGGWPAGQAVASWSGSSGGGLGALSYHV